MFDLIHERKINSKFFSFILLISLIWNLGSAWANDYFRGIIKSKAIQSSFSEVASTSTNPQEIQYTLQTSLQSYILEFRPGFNARPFDQKQVIIRGIKFEEDVGRPDRVKGIDVFRIYLEEDPNIHVGLFKIETMVDGEITGMSLEIRENEDQGKIRSLLVPEGVNDFGVNWDDRLVIVMGQKIKFGDTKQVVIRVQKLGLIQE